MSFRIARNPDARRAEVGTARRYSTLEGAVADMGDGVVFRSSGEIVAFHERHAWLLEHRGGTPWMAALARP